MASLLRTLNCRNEDFINIKFIGSCGFRGNYGYYRRQVFVENEKIRLMPFNYAYVLSSK